ncbi:MAG: HRDC domain-containing protein, partial [Acidobacteriota bacterium]
TAMWLSSEGMPALAYHAGLDAGERQRTQERFLNEDGVIVVATIAFGMGIDKPDVRFVAHLDTPRGIEAYYQETGRAGRDGLPADAWMAYGLQDIAIHRRLIDGSEAPDQHKRVERRRLGLLLGLCETTRCRRQVLLEYFGQRLAQACGNCDTCLTPVETWDATEAAQMALSCVYRTGQRFGAHHVIDVLTGTATDKAERFGHDRLPTFGVGAELTSRQWHSVLRQLVAHGLLDVEHQHGSLHLTTESAAVLKGERQLKLRHDPLAGRTRTGASAKPKRGSPAASLSEDDRAIFERLRAQRRRLAEAQRVPPYVIFHDATLVEMASRRPRSLEELATIGGVGQTKLERYGKAFLDVLDEAPPPSS